MAQMDGVSPEETPGRVRSTFGLILLLAIAYSASVGGIGTLIGSPTTVAFIGFAQERFPNEPPIAFADWSMLCIPIVVIFLPIMWLYLCRCGAEVPLSRIRFSAGQDVIAEERRRLGPMRGPEKTVRGHRSGEDSARDAEAVAGAKAGTSPASTVPRRDPGTGG